jgi:hypothetical protein
MTTIGYDVPTGRYLNGTEDWIKPTQNKLTAITGRHWRDGQFDEDF